MEIGWFPKDIFVFVPQNETAWDLQQKKGERPLKEKFGVEVIIAIIWRGL